MRHRPKSILIFGVMCRRSHAMTPLRMWSTFFVFFKVVRGNPVPASRSSIFFYVEPNIKILSIALRVSFSCDTLVTRLEGAWKGRLPTAY